MPLSSAADAERSTHARGLVNSARQGSPEVPTRDTIATVSDPEVWQQIPDGWPAASADLIEEATQKALQALSDDTDRPATERLAQYYDRAGTFVGASFVELQPNHPNDITATDLHALTLMKVEVLAGATRRLLDGTAHRPAILQALADVEHKDLLVAGPDDLLAMEKLYLAVRDVLSEPGAKSRNQWVTASKLCARKRYELFPVRDNVVCTYLGLIPSAKGQKGRGNYQIDYQVYRALIGNHRVIDQVDHLVDRLRGGVPGREVRLDTGRLRLLDAALWTWVDKSEFGRRR